MKSLTEIFAEGNSDKASLHGYDLVYEQLFKPLRLKPISLFEIGFLGGDSLEAWAKYFPSGTIHGLDLLDRMYRPSNDRIKIYFGDAGKKEVLDQVPGEFEVIIDDGPHTATQQIDTFTYLWPRVKPGGLYIEEDIHTVHSQSHCDNPYNIVNYFAKLACDMQDPAGAMGSAKYNPEHPRSDIESIEMRKGLIIVRKRP